MAGPERDHPSIALRKNLHSAVRQRLPRTAGVDAMVRAASSCAVVMCGHLMHATACVDSCKRNEAP